MNELGLQVIGGYSGSLAGPRGRPWAVKLIDCSPEYARQLRRELGPDCWIVVRWTREHGDWTDAAREAREWFGQMKNSFRAFVAAAGPRLAFETGRNEVPDDLAEKHVAWLMAIMRLFVAEGWRYVADNCGVGNHDPVVWPVYGPAIEYTRQTGNFWGVHEYWPDEAGIANDWWCCRWRIPAIAAVLQDVNLMVTECGRDVIRDHRRTYGLPGWRLAGISREQYLREFQAYIAKCRTNPQFVAALAFVISAPATWQEYALNDVWPLVVERYEPRIPPALEPRPKPEEPAPPPAPPATIPIVGRPFTPAEFGPYVDGLPDRPIRFVIAHHTWKPDEARWLQYGGAYWMKALARYYGSLGWTAGPHVFAAPDGIWVLSPLEQDGIHVSGWNAGTWAVELVGDFTSRLPAGEVLANGVAACAALLRKAGLGVDGLTNHRTLTPAASCPGAALVESWSWFVGLVRKELQQAGDRMLADVIESRWLSEEARRALKGLQYQRAHELLVRQTDILYRVENALKAR